MKNFIRFALTSLLLIASTLSCTKQEISQLTPERVPEKITVLSLNLFDQQQGDWKPDFRATRLRALRSELARLDSLPDLLFFQESQAKKKEETFISTDAEYFKKNYPYDHYHHESFGRDGFSYGYLVLSQREPKKIWPKKIWKDTFHFEGGSKRVIQFSLWRLGKSGCLGIANLHLSWQGSPVRVKEAEWLDQKLGSLKESCPQWLFLGDFNADENSPEMKFLFNRGFKDLFSPRKPTVGPFNPIRSIYGKIQSQTIDWALGIDIHAQAKVRFDRPTEGGVWISDHAGVWVEISFNTKENSD